QQVYTSKRDCQISRSAWTPSAWTPFVPEIVLPTLLRPAATIGLSPAGARTWPARSLHVLIGSVFTRMRPPAGAARHGMIESAAGGAQRVKCELFLPWGGRVLTAKIHYRTIPLSVKNKMTDERNGDS